MKIVSFFNTVGGSNIGLENFVAQSNKYEKYIYTASQPVAVAQKTLDDIYPNSGIQIIAGSDTSFIELYKIIKKLGGNIVVHTHHAKSSVVASLLKMLLRFKLVITVHNEFTTYLLKHKLAFIPTYILSDWLICNSENTKKSVPSFVSKNKMSVIYNGVNFSHIDEVMTESIATKDSKEEIVLGTVCRFVEQKDLPTLLKGFSLALQQTNKKIRLVMVGDGPLRNELEGIIGKLGLQDKVTFTGNVSRAEVYRQLTQMDIFAVTSRWEGFCNAMVEAAGAGLAVIASDVEPLPEVLGKSNALFFEVGKPESFADKLLQLIESKEYREQLAKDGRSFVKGQYDLVNSAAKYQEVYRKLL